MNRLSKKSKLSIIGFIVLICAGLIFYITVANPFVEEPEIVPFTGSIAYGYADLDELAKDSDLIAFVETGKVIKVDDGGAIPFTDVEFTVTKPIHNAEEEEKIVIKFSGGIVKGEDGKLKKMEITGDAVPEKGEAFLIFAKQREPDVYFTAGGPQGRYVLEEGVISPMGEYDNIIPRKGVDALEIEKSLSQILSVKE